MKWLQATSLTLRTLPQPVARKAPPELPADLPAWAVLARIESMLTQALSRVLGELERLHAALSQTLVQAKGLTRPASQEADGERLLDAGQAAEFLGVKQKYVYELAKRGDIPSIRLGKFVRFRPSDLRSRVSRTA